MKARKTLQTILSLMTLAAWTNLARADDLSATLKGERNPPLKRNSFEIRPIESVAAAAPGIASGGASFETYLGQNFALKVGGSYADVDLPNKVTATVTDKTHEPMVETGYGFSAGAGVRYYDYPIGNSIYAGGDIDYAEAHVGWGYKDESYKSTRYQVMPSLVAGYRWVWQNGMLVRLGGGAGLPSVPSQKVVATTDGADSQRGLDKINKTLDTKVLAKIDLGVGMMF